MPPVRRLLIAAALALPLGACGGSGANIDQLFGACGASVQKEWVLAQTRDWYLFPETLPSQVNLADFSDAQSLLDYLTQTAREQGRDRYFSYVTTSIEDGEFFDEGQYIGYGFNLELQGTSLQDAQLWVRWAYADSPVGSAGITRGAQITEIDDGSGFRSISQILSAGGFEALDAAIGPSQRGLRRGFRWQPPAGGSQQAYVTQDLVTLTPVGENGESAVLPLAGTAGVGYVHLLSFIGTAEAPLREVFADFRARGLSDFVIDLRYNGGGLVIVEELLANLLGALRSSFEVISYEEFNSRHSDANWTSYFMPQPESVAPLRIAFIVTDSSASASESIVNHMRPYADVAIVGRNTYGKPVGQIALQLEGCDTLLRLIAFRTVNSLGDGDYYDGLAPLMPGAACSAADDLLQMPGDPAESSTAAALDWLDSGACPAMSTVMAKNARTPLALPPRALWLSAESLRGYY